MRLRFLLLFFLGSIIAASAQLQSPERFLGYAVGSRYTPHHRLVSYFEHLSAQARDRVKLQVYGSTNEGRPLVAAFISSPENIARLDAIRSANLGLAAGQDQRAGTPVIVWLSYNVHGNEPSSSEAALRTAYALVSGEGHSSEWLRNTVVVIDPCLNPDGRDRYVNWFQSVSGKKPNALPDAREHREPWPGGRVNHYYFDLNRDWAWQTQVESQARMALYQSWLPQVHVDFHEQGVNNPYYFAPAAEPYHEVITPWQREFQKMIGQNHARYFDKAGWLYFTREVFDLFYPSYGDTYPLYSGAIGMTYEQGGGPAGGLAALTHSGDTLTLADRVEHHFTTGMSTIETASANATQLLQEYRNYFRTAQSSGQGGYRNYVVKHRPEDGGRIAALRRLLDRNGIHYTDGQSGAARGFSYESTRDESFTIGAEDLVIPSVQQRSALVRVLFEPNPRLADSLTYDITAWALPYVYGLKAYAARDLGGLRSAARPVAPAAPLGDAYGYVVRWDGVGAARFAGALLQAGVRLRFSERPFTLGGRRFERGTVIVLSNANRAVGDLSTLLRAKAAESAVELVPVSTGLVESGSDFGASSVRPLGTPKVAVLAGEGTSNNAVGEVWHYFEQVIDYPVTLINTTDFGRTDLSQFNVVVLPNGNYRFLSDKLMAESLRTWVSRGGKLIALEGAVSQLAGLDWGLKARKGEDSADAARNPYAALRTYGDREREEIANFTPGSIYRVTLDNTHPLAYGYSGTYYTLRQDDRVYEFFNEGGWNVGVVKKEKPLAGFVGNKLQPRMQDALVFGVQDLGSGSVVYFADDVLFRSFWENGKLLFANAVFLVGQ
ncbi:zinc carboxypeptidase [Flaviaesturariibacter flavus]|uniref:Zinc carboxypeptidase n=1 Tax=Flaviaesturariibacter flavus TaxID=2502780 RepID=A0A4R1B7X4_9BACT|nr:M14 metallopeptidase family protein [Flaviaesturariibacter flavus]TCJ12043.1 zinc carboxypeptidase [Flaviaesturariibacter flavus]